MNFRANDISRTDQADNEGDKCYEWARKAIRKLDESISHV